MENEIQTWQWVVLTIGAVLSMAMVWLVVVAPWLIGKKDERALQSAQNIEIARGVTLLQGIQAYFGNPGSWVVLIGSVRVRAHDPEEDFPVAEVFINVKTGRLEAYEFRHAAPPEDRNEPQALIHALVDAARRW